MKNFFALPSFILSIVSMFFPIIFGLIQIEGSSNTRYAVDPNLGFFNFLTDIAFYSSLIAIILGIIGLILSFKSRKTKDKMLSIYGIAISIIIICLWSNHDFYNFFYYHLPNIIHIPEPGYDITSFQ